MYCKQCGTEIEEGSVSCASCGTTVKEPMQVNDAFSMISLISGIVSLFMGGSLWPIIAIVCGAVSFNYDKTDKKALIGMILGGVELLLQICAVAGVFILYIAYLVIIMFLIITRVVF